MTPSARARGRRRSEKRKILFLCTGNAARSQMAEALARVLHGDMLDPVSAGTHPAGFVHPLAVRAMGEMGIDMSGATSKSAELFQETLFDLVVTVCDSAAEECPHWPKAKRLLHWSIEDPSYGPDDPERRYERFLETRDELRRRIENLVVSLERKGPGKAEP